MTIALAVAACCWVLFALYWIVRSLSQKQVAEKPPISSRIADLVLFPLAFVVLARPQWFRLSLRVLGDSWPLAATSVALSALGLAICVWARNALAGNWSGSIDLKRGHELVEHGPYAIVRHPIYTGFLSLFLGTALALGTLGGLAGFAILAIGSLLRIRNEEALLTRHFGRAYAAYKRRVRMLIPYVL